MKKKITLFSLLTLLTCSVFAQNIFKAAQSNDMAAVKYLLDKGVDVNAKNGNGDTPLIIAVKAKNIKLANFLLEKDADINTQDIAGNTALNNAVLKGANEEIELLINNRANIDIQNNAGATALMLAVNADNAFAAKTLLKSGANTFVKDAHDKSVFDYAKDLAGGDMSALLNATTTASTHNTER